MKKYFLSIVALAGMLFATSCQESLVEPQMEGPTTFTVQVPDAMGTKAIGDATNVDKLFVEVYSNGTSIFKKTQGINGSTTVSLDLIKGQEYQIVFWAQKDDSYITDFTTQGLAEISIPNTFHNNESGAAFYAYETFVIDGNAKTVTLRRPFAQLNLGTTALSLDTDASDADVQLISSSVTLATATKFSTIFGAGINVDTRTYRASISSFGDEKLTLANGDEYVYVSMDYLPVVDGGDVVELGVVIETNLGTITHNFTNVPIQKNYRTNIVGNLISSKTDFVVEVEDEWSGEENYNAEWGKLLYAAQNDGEVTLSANINLPEPIIVEGDMIVNLNDKTINAALFAESNGSINEGDTDSYAFWVKPGANLTINGKGKILTQPCKYSIAVWAEGGNVTINGGHYENQGEGSDLIYASAAGNIIINGGTFKACPKAPGVSGTNETYSALNLKDNTGSHITVYGGSFYKFNPADNKSENPQVNFCAPEYGVYQNGDWYEVLFTNGVTQVDAVVTNSTDLNSAMANGGTILLKEGEFGTIVAKSNVTLVGTPKAKVNCVALNDASNFTLYKVDFDAATAQNSYDGNGKRVGFANIISGTETFKTTGNSGANIVIDGCTFTGEFKNGGEAIAFTNQARSPYGKFTIKNCTFDIKGAYYDIYGHYFGMNNLVIESNTFKSNVHPLSNPIYLNRYQSNEPVIIKGNEFMTESSLEDAVYIQAHGSSYSVSLDASGNTFAN